MNPSSSPGIQAYRAGERLLLKRLRIETRDEHERLESELNLVRPDFDRPSYAQLLGRFYGFFKPWETRITEPLSRFVPEFGLERRKTPLLLDDLHFLGVPTNRFEFCSRLPSCQTLEELLGSLYVTEGSTLGGQLIARHLEKCLGFSGGRGYAFFSSYKGEVGRMWQTFQSMLLDYLPEELEDAAIASARETFRLMRAWLCCPVVP